MKDHKVLNVSAIENGTVIDHIPAENLFKVISILKLDAITENQMSFGTNYKSARLGRKAIVKISDKYFEDIEIDKIALVAPHAKLNIIRDYTVIEKREVNVPKTITGFAKCMNPKCITNNERVTTQFTVLDDAHIMLKCRYCEKVTDEEHLEII